MDMDSYTEVPGEAEKLKDRILSQLNEDVTMPDNIYKIFMKIVNDISLGHIV